VTERYRRERADPAITIKGTFGQFQKGPVHPGTRQERGRGGPPQDAHRSIDFICATRVPNVVIGSIRLGLQRRNLKSGMKGVRGRREEDSKQALREAGDDVPGVVNAPCGRAEII